MGGHELGFKEHINKVVNKVNSTLGLSFEGKRLAAFRKQT